LLYATVCASRIRTSHPSSRAPGRSRGGLRARALLRASRAFLDCRPLGARSAALRVLPRARERAARRIRAPGRTVTHRTTGLSRRARPLGRACRRLDARGLLGRRSCSPGKAGGAQAAGGRLTARCCAPLLRSRRDRCCRDGCAALLIACARPAPPIHTQLLPLKWGCYAQPGSEMHARAASLNPSRPRRARPHARRSTLGEGWRRAAPGKTPARRAASSRAHCACPCAAPAPRRGRAASAPGGNVT